MKKPQYEIVRVVDRHWLIDSESYQRPYRLASDIGLERGVYIVVWEEGEDRLAYDEHPKYLGPFPSRAHAESALRSVLKDRDAEQRAA